MSDYRIQRGANRDPAIVRVPRVRRDALEALVEPIQPIPYEKLPEAEIKAKIRAILAWLLAHPLLPDRWLLLIPAHIHFDEHGLVLGIDDMSTNREGSDYIDIVDDPRSLCLPPEYIELCPTSSVHGTLCMLGMLATFWFLGHHLYEGKSTMAVLFRILRDWSRDEPFTKESGFPPAEMPACMAQFVHHAVKDPHATFESAFAHPWLST